MLPLSTLDSISVEEYHEVQPLDIDELNANLARIEWDSPKPTDRAAVRDYSLLSLAINAGHRLKAVQSLQWGDVQVKGGAVYITWRRINGGKSRKGEKIGRATGEALLSWRDECLTITSNMDSNAPIWIQLARNRVGGLLRKAAITDICRRRRSTSRFHVLRHTSRSSRRWQARR